MQDDRVDHMPSETRQILETISEEELQEQHQMKEVNHQSRNGMHTLDL